MVNNNIFTLITLVFFSLASTLGVDDFMGNNLVHEIIVHHPGMKDDIACKLIEQKNDLDKTIAFYMDVESVICLDGKCKVVNVRLFWDRLGAYSSYKLEKGVALEKKDGELFTDPDYDKLHKILKDKESLFREFELGEVVDVKKDNAGIDAISGATVLTEEHATVKGATWTCYTLWHWANGEVQNVIKNITKKTTTKADLIQFFNLNNEQYTTFAIDQFREQNLYDNSTLELVKNHIDSFGIIPLKSAVAYFKTAPPPVFLSTLKQLFPTANKKQRLLYLKSLLDRDTQDRKLFLSTLSEYIPQLKSYQEFNLVVDFLQDNDITSPEVNAQLINFLEHDNFIIARRIYWYLSDQNLKSAEQKSITKFEMRHADSL